MEHMHAHGMPMTQVAIALVYKALLKETTLGDKALLAMFPHLACMADTQRDSPAGETKTVGGGGGGGWTRASRPTGRFTRSTDPAPRGKDVNGVGPATSGCP